MKYQSRFLLTSFSYTLQYLPEYSDPEHKQEL